MLSFNIKLVGHIRETDLIHADGPIVIIAFRVSPKYISICQPFSRVFVELVVTEDERPLVIWIRSQVDAELRFHAAALLGLDLLEEAWELWFVGLWSKTNKATC